MSHLKKKTFLYWVIFLFLILIPITSANDIKLSENTGLRLNGTFSNVLYDYRLGATYSNHFLDTNSKTEKPTIFYTIDRHEAIYYLNTNFNKTIEKIDTKEAFLQGICRKGNYSYTYNDYFDKIVEIDLNGNTVERFDSAQRSAEGLDCTDNHIWILEDGGSGGDLHIYNYSGGQEDSCNLPNANSGLWVEKNEKYFWRTELAQDGKKLFVYKYYYNNSGCYLKSNFSLSDFGIPITGGESRGMVGNYDGTKLWLGIDKGNELTRGTIYEFDIRKEKRPYQKYPLPIDGNLTAWTVGIQKALGINEKRFYAGNKEEDAYILELTPSGLKVLGYQQGAANWKLYGWALEENGSRAGRIATLIEDINSWPSRTRYLLVDPSFGLLHTDDTNFSDYGGLDFISGNENGITLLWRGDPINKGLYHKIKYSRKWNPEKKSEINCQLPNPYSDYTIASPANIGNEVLWLLSSDPKNILLKVNGCDNPQILGKINLTKEYGIKDKIKRVDYEVSSKTLYLASNSYAYIISLKNSPPVATKPSIIQTAQQNLLCKTNVSDPDNDSVNISYSWFINGKRSSIDTKILPKAEFKGIDKIICQVRPYDGKLYGEAKNSSIHIIQPKLPKGKVLILTNTSWKNILSVSNLNKPTIVSDEINGNVKHYIKRYEPGKIYIIGDIQYETNKYDITKISDLDRVQEVFYSNKGGILVDSAEGGIVSSGLASLLRKPLVFSEDGNISIDLRNKTNDEILGKYLDEVDKRGKNINYLVISSKKYPFAGILTARNGAYPVLIPEHKLDNTEFIRGKINEAVEKLNKKNFYIESPKYPLNGAYVLLSGGIRSIKKEDPVENLLVFNDPLDGESFRSDLEYGDLNNNDVIDVSVGRLPKDEPLSSLIFARKYLSTNDKKTLVASEYLYTAWPVILAYIGGGMFNGKTIANILRRQNYNVSRLVEQRARPIKFLTGLAPVSIKSFLDESKEIGDKVSSLIGKNIGKAISRVLVSIKALKYVEEGLELYLEYDWNSFGPKLSNAKGIAKSIVMTREKTPQKIAAKLVYILWPNPYPKLNKENLKSELKDANLIYYEGIGNGTKWILPNPIGKSGFMDWQEFLKERYSGENTFTYKEIPNLKSRLVWDNSNLATEKDKKMWRTFLERGSATYIGASGVNYAPYSSGIDSRFFRGGGTIGKALKDSVNHYKENFVTYDPFNMAIRGGEIKAKTLREFILYGDPSLRKNPIIKADNATETDVECNGNCHLTVRIKTPHRTVSKNKTRTIITSSSDYLINAFEPIIPIKKFDYYLPHEAQLLDYEIRSDKEKYENITFPTVNPLSHGNTYINKTLDEGIYPQKAYRLNINKTIDGRTKIQLVHSLIQYNRESQVAKVFDEIELQIDYETPIEMYILPGNVRSGGIKIKLINNKEREFKGKLYTKIINQTGNKLIERNFTLEPKSSNIVKIDSNQKRKFLVKALASTDAFNLGPRKEIFDLKKKIDFGPIDYLKISSEEILKIYKTLKGKIIKYFKPSKEKTQIKEPKFKFVEKMDDNKKVIKIINSDFKLIITKNKDKIVNNLTSSQGNMLIIKKRGKTIEKVKGNKNKLHSQYKLAKELIREKIKEN